MKVVNQAGEILIPAGGGGGATFFGGMSNIGNTSGDTGVVSGRMVLAGGNNVTLSGSTNGASITITISAANQTNQTGGIYHHGNTTGQSSSSTYDARSLSISGGGIVSVGWSLGSFIISATQSNQAFSAAGGSSTFQTLSFNNANGFTFSNVGGAIQGSYTVPVQSNQTIGFFAVGNSTQNSSTTLDARTVSFGGRGDISVGFSNGTIQISGSQSNQVMSFFAVSNTTQSTSGTVNASSVIFAGAGVASVGITNGSVVISVPAINVSAGTTSQNLSNLVFSDANGVSFGLNGSTITGSVAAAGGGVTVSQYAPFDEAMNVAGQVGQGTLFIQPMFIPSVQHDRLALRMNFTNSSNSTGSVTISLWAAIYTRNASTLSMASSSSTTIGLTFSGTGGNQSLQAGPRVMTMGWTNTIPAGHYFFALVSRTTSGGANASVSNFLVSQMSSVFSGVLGVASNATRQKQLGQGIYSATTSGIPASIAFSQISGTAAVHHSPPIFYLLSQTV